MKTFFEQTPFGQGVFLANTKRPQMGIDFEVPLGAFPVPWNLECMPGQVRDEDGLCKNDYQVGSGALAGPSSFEGVSHDEYERRIQALNGSGFLRPIRIRTT